MSPVNPHFTELRDRVNTRLLELKTPDAALQINTYRWKYGALGTVPAGTMFVCENPSLVGMASAHAETVDGGPPDIEAQWWGGPRNNASRRFRRLLIEFGLKGGDVHTKGDWHCYVTNLPTSMLEAKHIWATYAARWEVELMFRELKSKYRLNHMRSKSRHVAECLVYAALLTLVLSRKLYQVLLSRWRADRRRFPFDRWATLVASIASDLLDLLISRHDRRLRERKLDTFLRTEAPDPNAHRLTLASRAEMGHFARA